MHILKLQNFVAMPQTDINDAFLVVTPRSRSFDFIVSRTAHLLHFLTLFDRSPYLVLLGARPTVLGHNLEKYESSAILSAGRQHEKKIITFLIAYRQPPPPKQKLTENSNFLFKSSKLQKIENFKPNSKFLQFWPEPLRFWNISTIPRQKLLFKD